MAAILKWTETGNLSDFYLIASTFDIGGGLMSKKNLVSDFHGWRVHSTHVLAQKRSKMHEKYV